MRLLPRNTELGWTPYAWLVYVAIIPMYLVMGRASPRTWALHLLGMLAFLVLYFVGYWVRGTRLLLVVAGLHILGTVFVPLNWGASCYFIYAAGFLGRVRAGQEGSKVLAGYLALLGLQAWILAYAAPVWIPAIVFSALIGAVNMHFSQVHRANSRLRLAHEEIQRLAAIAERERIARDLHDVLGHTLSLIILKAELASKLADRDPARAIREIREVERVSRDALAQVRSAVHGYRAGSLRAELLSAGEALRTAGLDVVTEVGEVELFPAQEGVLALALREAATNVIRHAVATRCTLSLSAVNGACRLEVSDDGRGSGAVDGAGLQGMRERVEALGGTVMRETSRGTRLVITIPLGAPAPPAFQPSTAVEGKVRP